jgi:uncharacterized phage protein (TIGR02218 family)
MRPSSTALQTFLASKQPFWSADLLTLIPKSAATLYLASGDQDITYGGTTWLCASSATPGFTRNTWSIKNTIEVPSLDIDLISSGTDYASGANIKLALHDGLLDGSWIQLDRAFMPVINGVYGNTSLGTVGIFYGRGGQVQITATGAKITVRGANVLMQQYMPKNRYMLGCIHALYDAGCTKNRASFTYSGTVASASATEVNWVADPTSGNYANLALGYLTMTSGVADGTLRTIQAASSTGVLLMYPLYQTPAPGDTFTVTFGCDKTLATCTNRFSNAQHFRGFPFVPPAEAAVVG